MRLHTINKRAALALCEGLIAPDDVVLLLEDGVYLAMEALSFDCRVIEADAKARGIHDQLRTGSLISYDEFVELCSQADQVCAWF